MKSGPEDARSIRSLVKITARSACAPKPIAAAGLLTDGLTPADLGTPYLNVFPYLGVPYDGYDHPAA